MNTEVIATQMSDGVFRVDTDDLEKAFIPSNIPVLRAILHNERGEAVEVYRREAFLEPPGYCRVHIRTRPVVKPQEE